MSQSYGIFEYLADYENAWKTVYILKTFSPDLFGFHKLYSGMTCTEINLKLHVLYLQQDQCRTMFVWHLVTYYSERLWCRVTYCNVAMAVLKGLVTVPHGYSTATGIYNNNCCDKPPRYFLLTYITKNRYISSFVRASDWGRITVFYAFKMPKNTLKMM
jgi:hypothetical protein